MNVNTYYREITESFQKLSLDIILYLKLTLGCMCVWVHWFLYEILFYENNIYTTQDHRDKKT